VTGRPVVIGVGNPSRSDDGIGWAVATAAGHRLGQAVDVRWCDGEPGRLLDAWADADLVVVVDAICSGAEPGAIRLLSPSAAESGRSGAHLGTHALGVRQAAALGRALGRIPRSLMIVGIEGHDHGFGDTLSEPVAAAVEPAVDLVASIVRGAPQRHGTAGGRLGTFGPGLTRRRTLYLDA
jgi:hydrogenase maturation protease